MVLNSFHDLFRPPAANRKLLWQQVTFIRDETATQEICSNNDWLVGSDLYRKRNIGRRIWTCLWQSPGEIPCVLRQQRDRACSRFAWIRFRGCSWNRDTHQIGSINVQEIYRYIGGSTAAIEDIKVRRVSTGAVIKMRGCADPNEWWSA